MPLDSNSPLTAYTAEKKDLYDMGEMPPLGHVPKQMYGWAIRKERHGEPDTAMLQEVLDVPELDNYDVLVLVMAAVLTIMEFGPLWACQSAPLMAISNPITSRGLTRRESSGLWAQK